MSIPIIDLFAGPGGLGEGFASVRSGGAEPFFKIGVSVEKDPVAHKTLTLRAVYRQLKGSPAVKFYHQFARGEITLEQFENIPEVAAAFVHARGEAKCMELGKHSPKELDGYIKGVLNGESLWVLIGGPPCQAYSVAGRARRVKDEKFHEDEKHFLYREYLRIIKDHRPAIFVMENVKGLLSSKHGDDPMFSKILGDLSKPASDLYYEIRSFVKKAKEGGRLEPSDYVIEAEKYGIPQKRHRVILLGIRNDLAMLKHSLLTQAEKTVTVKQAIGDLPRIRSKLSKQDSFERWYEVVSEAPSKISGWGAGGEKDLIAAASACVEKASRLSSVGDRFLPYRKSEPRVAAFKRWVIDRALGGYTHHMARSHMDSDLSRYLFSSTYAKLNGYSPRLHVFPKHLLPAHANAKNANKDTTPFKDRFRVQCATDSATTVVSHIAKDGHYYIHYDPTQCRALTVREAARLQTFPDNYYFMGTRTEQYVQVGNAVPPLLANQLAKIVRKLIADALREGVNQNAEAGRETRRTALVPA